MECDMGLWSQIVNGVSESICDFALHDRDLLKIDINERSITHRLAVYLGQKFGGYNVDCEYNRVRKDIKCMEFEYPAETSTKSLKARTVYPDIIVHKRMEQDSNCLIVEAKKDTSSIDSFFDKSKLSVYTTAVPGGYGYKFGLFLEFDCSGANIISDVIVFINSKQDTERTEQISKAIKSSLKESGYGF